MLEQYEKLVDEFRNTIRTHEEEKEQLKQVIRNRENDIRVLRKKLERYYDQPEVSKNELYLVDKIERLEKELQERDCK